jgi:hypothetical protein
LHVDGLHYASCLYRDPVDPPTAGTGECVELRIGPASESEPGQLFPMEAAHVCPALVSRDNWVGTDTYQDTYEITQSAQGVTVVRIDTGDRTNHGWGMNLRFKCCVGGSRGGETCPRDHPYAYHTDYGYCCATNKEKPGCDGCDGGCDGSTLHAGGVQSMCCENDAYSQCPQPPCADYAAGGDPAPGGH